jgi:hypothetical protein
MDHRPPEQLTILAHESQGPKVIGLVVTFTVLALASVLLRFFARVRFTRLVGWEDYFIALSMVCTGLIHNCTAHAYYESSSQS